MKITIVTSSQKDPFEGKFLGGASFVTQRYARSLSDLVVRCFFDFNK